MAGLTDEGLEIKRLVDVIDSLNTRLVSAYGTEINLEEDSLVSQIRDLFAADIAEVWELAQAVDDAFKIDVAEGTNLDDLASLNKITRLSATSSLVREVFKGDLGTSIPATTALSVENSGEQFSVDSATVLSISPVYEVDINCGFDVHLNTDYTATINSTPFTYNSGGSPAGDGSDIAAGLKALIDAGSEPVTTSTDVGTLSIVSSDVTLDFTLAISSNLAADKVGQFVDVSAVSSGPVLAPAGRLTIIETPVSGVDSVYNPDDEVTGRDQETDTELRLRRNQSLAIAGVATLDAIIDKVGQIAGVTKSVGFENVTLIEDLQGLPGKSFEIVVEGGDNQDIADTIWNSKPSGIESFGGTPETVTDVSGTVQTVYFSRPVDVDIYVEVDFTQFDEESFPSDGIQAIEDAILAYGATLDLGEDVIPNRFMGPVYAAVTGIEDLTIKMDNAPSPTTTTTVEIASKEVSKFTSINITINDVTTP